ncbi:N-acetyltransferase [Hyphomicrobium sp. D-2]|uniref:GNAT family N-acetyltransferase n=1 Tax=Hyphomicrobium sp. D-2 TaxID=3041621 RepID=UPI0032AFB07D
MPASASPNVMTSSVVDRPMTAADFPVVSRLHAEAFGPGRFARTAYRVREGTNDLSRYCRVAMLGDRTIAAVGFTPITIGGKPGALLLGPLVVHQDFTDRGHGTRLILQAMDAARADGLELMLLVGDEPYYGRFGYRAVPMGQIRLPGPVNPQRLLAAELQPDALSRFSGAIAGQRS